MHVRCKPDLVVAQHTWSQSVDRARNEPCDRREHCLLSETVHGRVNVTLSDNLLMAVLTLAFAGLNLFARTALQCGLVLAVWEEKSLEALCL